MTPNHWNYEQQAREARERQRSEHKIEPWMELAAYAIQHAFIEYDNRCPGAPELAAIIARHAPASLERESDEI